MVDIYCGDDHLINYDDDDDDDDDGVTGVFLFSRPQAWSGKLRNDHITYL